MAQVYKNAALEAAKVASRQPEFGAMAARVESRIKAMAPVESGDFKGSIKTKTERTKQGVLDRVIYSDHPQAGNIEFGHMARRGKGSVGPPRWVPGHFTFCNAVRSF